MLLKPWNSLYWFSFHHSTSFYLFMQYNKRISVMESFTIKQLSKFSSPLSNSWCFCREKSVFSLMCVGESKLLPRWHFFHNIHVNFSINYCKKWKNLHFYTLTDWISIIVIINHTSDSPTPFFKGEGSKFWSPLLDRGRGEPEKLKKGGGKMV